MKRCAATYLMAKSQKEDVTLEEAKAEDDAEADRAWEEDRKVIDQPEALVMGPQTIYEYNMSLFNSFERDHPELMVNFWKLFLSEWPGSSWPTPAARQQPLWRSYKSV